MKKPKELKQWEDATEKIALYFITKYFGNDIEDLDFYWIAGEIGGVFYINDHFFEINEMVDFIKYNYSAKKMFEYQEYHLRCIEKREFRVNIKNYKKLKISP